MSIMEEELGTKDDPDGDASKIAPILNNFAAKPDLGMFCQRIKISEISNDPLTF